MRTILYGLAFCWLLLPAGGAFAADRAPDALVKSTVEDVLGVIRQSKDRRALRELAEQKVLPNFDFRRMTQLAAGPAWRHANPAQQQALENGFRGLLVNTYTAALSAAATGTQSVEVKPVRANAGEDEVTVKTVVKDAGKPPLAIDYRMQRSPEGWKVFDVVVENLSLVVNHRGTFAAEVERSGIDGLIETLEQKNRAFGHT